MYYSVDSSYTQALSVPDDVGPAIMGRTPLVGTVRRQADLPVLRDMLGDAMGQGSSEPSVDAVIETQNAGESDSVDTSSVEPESDNNAVVETSSQMNAQSMSQAADDRMEMKEEITSE